MKMWKRMTKLTMKIWREEDDKVDYENVEEDDKADYVAVPERPEGTWGTNYHRGLLRELGTPRHVPGRYIGSGNSCFYQTKPSDHY